MIFIYFQNYKKAFISQEKFICAYTSCRQGFILYNKRKKGFNPRKITCWWV